MTAPVYAYATVLPPMPINPRWEDGPEGRMMVVDVRDLERARIIFEVDRGAAGHWVRIEEAAGLVQGGVAKVAAPRQGLLRTGQAELRFRARIDFDPPPVAVRFGEKRGDEVELLAELPHSEGRLVRFLVERREGDGHWAAAGHATEEVRDGTARALVKIARGGLLRTGPCELRFRADALDPAPENPRFGELPAAGGPVEVLADAAHAEGRTVSFVCERNDGGHWQVAGVAEATVKDGLARAFLTLAPRRGLLITMPSALRLRAFFDDEAAQAPAPKNLRWLRRPPRGEPAEVAADVPRGDGRTVRFVVERRDGARWTPAGSANALVLGGVARARVQVEKRGGLLATGPDEVRLRASLD